MNQSLWMDDSLIRQLRADMLGFAQLQLRHSALAEDAVQEALAAAFANAAKFSGRSAMKTWVFAILRNKIIDLIREQSRTSSVSTFTQEDQTLDQAFEHLFKANEHWHPDCAPVKIKGPEGALQEKHFFKVLEACLSVLPESTARIFMMREMLELEVSEICHHLDMEANHCHVVLHRARNALRRCLEKTWLISGEAPC